MSDARSEQETCRTFVVPELRAAGWGKRQIREQYRITNRKIIASARRHRPGNPLVADYVLEYRDDVPLAVVEAKRTKVDAAAGIEQAKRYAQQLELPVAYATNGHEILSKTPPSTDHRCGSSMTRSTSRVSEWLARSRLARTTPSRSLSTEDDDTADQIMAQGKRIYVDGVEVYVWNDVHYQLESDGRTLRLVEHREFVRDRVMSMNLSPTDLRTVGDGQEPGGAA
jgi:type I site-specific restriction endonuclease